MCCWRKIEKINWTEHVRNEEVLLRVKEQRNILHEISKRKVNWIGHILRRNCLLQQVIEGKIKGGMEVTGRRGRRRRKLLDDLKERRRDSHLKKEDLDRTMWRARFGRDFEPVARQTTKWMNEWIKARSSQQTTLSPFSRRKFRQPQGKCVLYSLHALMSLLTQTDRCGKESQEIILIFYSNTYPTRCSVTQFILSGNCSTCFWWYHHPSPGAQTTLSTASGICQTVTATVWQIPDAVDTVVCAPDDGWRYHPKHVEQFPDKINCATLHLVGYILEYSYDARTHEH